MAGYLAPTQKPLGPDFIDQEGCRCALQTSIRYDPSSQKDGTEAWRCLGNINEDIYTGNSGKWFLPSSTSSSADLSEPETWAGNPPDLSQTYVVMDSTPTAYDYYNSSDPSQLSSIDLDCTGQNNTSRSQQYYAAVKNTFSSASNSSTPVCLQPQGQPIPFQNATSWNQIGCSLGFFCPFILFIVRVYGFS